MQWPIELSAPSTDPRADHGHSRLGLGRLDVNAADHGVVAVQHRVGEARAALEICGVILQVTEVLGRRQAICGGHEPQGNPGVDRCADARGPRFEIGCVVPRLERLKAKPGARKCAGDDEIVGYERGHEAVRVPVEAVHVRAGSRRVRACSPRSRAGSDERDPDLRPDEALPGDTRVEHAAARRRRGRGLWLLGPNGAGKTTTIRLLLGLHRPTSGSAQLFGIDAWKHPVSAHRHVAYVAGEPFLWPALTSEETFELFARLRGGTDVDYRDELVERFQLDAKKKVRALSKGNRQKVQLVAALSTRADLLLLDEPTAGLDPLMEVAFRECINEAKERGQTVFLSSHILSEVEALCDRVGILRRGELVDEGTLEQLRHLSEHTVEATFAGTPPQLDSIPGVAVERTGANGLRFTVTGPVQPLLAVLAEHPVSALTSREPSLEEIFLHHYDSSDGVGG